MSHPKIPRNKYGQKSNMLPGTPVYTGTMDFAPRMMFTCYDENSCKTELIHLPSDFDPDACKEKYWLHICGLNHVEEIAALGHILHLHPLLIEDVLNIHTQPKIEEFDNCVLVILKRFNSSDKLSAPEQISLVLSRHYVLSFQENDVPLFPHIQKALEENTGKIRAKGPDHLFALLLDQIVDSYLPEIDRTEELLVDMENKMLNDDRKLDSRSVIILNRKRYQVLKKTIVHFKDSFPRLFRLENNLIEKSTTAYLRDVYDHLEFATQSIESYHDMLINLINIYMSNNDLHMNQIMQRLTLVSTVFIPLSFLVGVWGMNYDIMPELRWKYGYLVAWLILLGTGITIWRYLKKRMY